MRAFRNVLIALFRPARGVDGAGTALKWMWIPLGLLLLWSVATKTTVSTPMSIVDSQQAAEARLNGEESPPMPEAKGEASQDPGEGDGEEIDADVAAQEAAMSTSSMVFAVLGAAVAFICIATFFFVAAKTWANPVGYTTMLSIASLSLVPHALRNFLQAMYMSASGVWLKHPGLGALVAPSGPTDPPGLSYAILSQVDIWVLWGLAVLLGALLSQTVGIGRKRAFTGMITFIALAGILQAIPILVRGAFLSSM